ncbi:MAG TPA: hypothetical protein VG106_05990 [Vicinamibacterales bacterium]|nr:hypothetical protein [Vicinamibacterales bacterium]
MTSEYPAQPTSAWEPPADAPPGQYAPPAPSAPRRSGWITTSAVILLAIGAITGLFSLVFVLLGVVLGSAMSDLMTLSVESGIDAPDQAAVETMSGFMTGFFIAFAIIGLVWAVAHVAAGVGILGGRGWARITGMVLAIIGILFSALGLLGIIASVGMTEAMLDDPAFRDLYGPGLTPESMSGALIVNVLFIAPFLIGYVITLVALIRNGAFFDRRRVA